MTQVLTGHLHANNKEAISWGWNDVIAIGCHSWVVLIQPTFTKRLLTLKGHKSIVNHVCWNQSNPVGRNLLASSDISGVIIVWDAFNGSIFSSFKDNSTTISQMQWINWENWPGNYLLTLHSPYNLILWNVESGDKLWKKGYTDSLLQFSLDPFHNNSIAMVTTFGNLLLANDLSFNQAPSSNGMIFALSDHNSMCESIIHSESSSIGDVKKSSMLNQSAKFIRKPFITILQAANQKESAVFPSEDSHNEGNSSQNQGENAIIQAIFHPAARNILLVVYSHVVQFIEIASQQTVAQIIIDKSASPFLQVMPCQQKDALFLVQENGIISFRTKKINNGQQNLKIDKIDIFKSTSVTYELLCCSESLRITKNCRLSAWATNPNTNMSIALFLTSGKMLLHQLARYSLLSTAVKLSHLLPINSTESKDLRLCLIGYLTCIGQNAKVMRSRRLRFGIDHKKLMQDQPREFNDMIAVGTQEGCIQLIDCKSGTIFKDIVVHSVPVRCIDWAGANLVISAGYSHTLSTSNIVRNELHSTDINNGRIRVVRPEGDESPIQMIRVSFHHCYLAVAFVNQPLEIWHLKSLRLLRKMTKNCPRIMDMAWSGKHNSNKENTTNKEDNQTINVYKTETNIDRQIYRENLVVLDNEDRLYHVVVKGMHVRDGKEVNTQWTTTSHMNCMAWKDDILAFGDGEGRLSVWNLNIKQSKASQSQRGAVKRLQFSSTYKDYTLLILHQDGVSTWDAINCRLLGELYTPKDISCRVLDVDLLDSEHRIACLTEDGCVSFYDYNLEYEMCRVKQQCAREVFCPSILPAPMIECFEALICDKRLLQADLLKTGEQNLNVANHIILDQIKAAEIDFDAILKDKTTIQRAEIASVFLGDEFGAQFWSAVNLKLNPDLAKEYPYLDMFYSQKQFKDNEMLRASCVELNRANSEQIRNYVDTLLLLGEACLLSSVNSSAQCHSTIKLVATNLIALGKIQDGVQLLCVIDKNIDACRYLQSNLMWNKAAWLAKVSLNEENCMEFMNKWAEKESHMKLKSLQILISIGEWNTVIKKLLNSKHAIKAAILMQIMEENNIELDPDLVQTIYVEYASELFGCGLNNAAKLYSQLAANCIDCQQKLIEIEEQ